MTPKILQIVCEHFSVSFEELQTKSRKPRLVQPRFVACWLLRRYTDLNYRELVELLYPYLNPQNNHDVPIYAIRAIENCLRLQDWIYREVLEVEEKCSQLFYPLKKAS